jgi:hypothetical protein
MEAVFATRKRRLGNQAGSDTAPVEGYPQGKNQGTAAGTPLFLQRPASSPRLFIQTKLSIGAVDDAYEQEADRVADTIVTGASSTSVQRKCACGGSDCESCAGETATVQRSATNSAATNVPTVVHEVVGSPGQPLEHTTRRSMEASFGKDLSGVRLHTDTRAAESAKAVNAVAYTVGRNIVFGPGRYEPTSAEGSRLLAHEITHVVQQGAVSFPSRLVGGRSEDRHEQAAETPAQSPSGMSSALYGGTEIKLQRIADEEDRMPTEGEGAQSDKTDCGVNPINCKICFDRDRVAWARNCEDDLRSGGSYIYVDSQGTCHRRLDPSDFKLDRNCPVGAKTKVPADSTANKSPKEFEKKTYKFGVGGKK